MRELISKQIVLLTSVLIVILTIFFAASQNQDETKIKEEITQSVIPKTTALDLIKIQKGKELFSKEGCIRCHSIEGKGNKRNPLDGVGDRLEEKILEAWIIGAGLLQDKIPERAFKQKQKYKQLPPDARGALVEYMQSLRFDKNIPATEKEPLILKEPSAEKFATGENGTCLECHSNAGHMRQTIKQKDVPADDGCATAPSRPLF